MMRKQWRRKQFLQAKHALLAAVAYPPIISIILSDVESIVQAKNFCIVFWMPHGGCHSSHQNLKVISEH
tara:strand:- start:828 stop:1034 length:207 start_codon:yes stop_codon:yes gene_type:complete